AGPDTTAGGAALSSRRLPRAGCPAASAVCRATAALIRPGDVRRRAHLRNQHEGPMPLLPVSVSSREPTLPGDVRRLLREADRRIRRFQFSHRVPAFLASDFARVWSVLRFLEASDLAPGRSFCEWGSGLGVVSCMAAMLDFDAWGIEI